MRNIAILGFHDLATAFRNKTLYLIILTPLFVFLALELIDESDTAGGKISLGLLGEGRYSPLMIESLESAAGVFTLSRHASEAEAQRWLRETPGAGILLPDAGRTDSYVLIVLTRASFETLAIVESLAALQRATEGKSQDWIGEIRPLREDALQRQMLPTWVLMLVLLVGFVVLPAQVAEEKEKKLLLGLLQTPMHELEWLLAKVVYGTILVVLAVLTLHLLTRSALELNDALKYFALLIAGAFCFCSFGVLVGFLCRTQASARTLGVLFYLPHLLPSALAEFSESLDSVAPLIPSYQLYRPIKFLLLEGDAVAWFPRELLALVGVGIVCSSLSYFLLKKRWLMN